MDLALRQLERAALAGDPSARQRLIRALERSGDQAALCALGVHRVLAAWKPERAHTRFSQQPWVTGCAYCPAWSPVHWVHQPTLVESIVFQEALWQGWIWEGPVAPTFSAGAPDPLDWTITVHGTEDPEWTETPKQRKAREAAERSRQAFRRAGRDRKTRGRR